MERISDYLLCGEGVWWHRESDVIVFYDGDESPKFNGKGPSLKNFESESLQSVHAELKKCWEKCLSENISLPLRSVRVFDHAGDYVETRDIPSHVGDMPYHIDDGEEENVELIPVEGIYDTCIAGETHNIVSEEEDIQAVTLSKVDTILTDTHDTDANNINFKSKCNKQKAFQYTFNLKSNIGKTICKVIGISPGLREFDTHHVLFKNFKYEQSRVMCQRRLLELQRKVKEEYEMAKIFVGNWEKNYFEKYGITSGKNQLDEDDDYSHNYIKYINGKKLMQLWKIK